MDDNNLNKQNGKVISTLGHLKLEFSYENGVLNGEYFVWYKDNIKIHQGNYKNGKFHGKILEWNKDGSQKSEIYYQDDKKHGKSLEWIIEWIGINKYIIKIESYYQYNKKNGDFIKYFEDAKIKEQGFYIDDELEGKYTIWNNEGEVEALLNYKNGKLHGLNKWTWDTGAREEHYQDGIKEGRTVFFYKNDNKKAEYFFKNGKLHGVYLAWHEDGSKDFVHYYEDGELICKYYDEILD